MTTFDDLEARLQSLLEVRLLEYLPGYKIEDRIFRQLANAMHLGLRNVDEKLFAPNTYVIIAHPYTLNRWRSLPVLLEKMAEAIKCTGEEAGFHFYAIPKVSTAENVELTGDSTHIVASFSSESIEETRGEPSGFQTVNPAENLPINAFLVMDGNNIIPVNLPVLNIGRRLTNQVVINDKRVSRNHAQLRVSKGHYALFDINSSGGTFVNGRRINQTILNPGDVISLGGYTLVYGQDLPPGQSTQKVIVSERPYIRSSRSIHKLRSTGVSGGKKPKKS